jgi:hypothetical protein
MAKDIKNTHKCPDEKFFIFANVIANSSKNVSFVKD